MSIELRQDVRKRTFLRGRIVFNGGSASMDCLIRDLSSNGARLELSETSTLPEVFDLYIPNKDATFRSTMCWRRGGEIGVTFVVETARTNPPQPAPAADASLAILVRRIADLEAENAALRSLLTKTSQPSAA